MKTNFTVEQLATLAAVADTGGFERAAAGLHVTTSAVSQRIRALESAMGTVLVRRGAPCTLTPEGSRALRYARQMALLEAELRAEVGGAATSAGGGGAGDEAGAQRGPAAVIELPVAVNADSLATWFPAVFGAAATWPDVRLALHVEDEEHTAALLRDGVVLAAVSADDRPVAGCRVEPLVTMTYLPVVHPDLLARAAGRGADESVRAATGGVDLRRLPVVRFDDKDELQDRMLRAAGVADTASIGGPRVPDPRAFVAAVAAGLGWGMVPTAMLPADAGLVAVPRLRPAQRRLSWHRWKLDSPALDRLTEAVHRAAAAGD